MAKLTQKEFMEQLKAYIGDKTDDATIKFVEDCKDTITDDGDDWKQMYDDLVKEKEELDKTWRQKYTERFFASSDSHNDNNDNENHDANRKTNPASHVDNNDVDEEQKKIDEAEKIRIDNLFTPIENK